jgi:hypothetical protein
VWPKIVKLHIPVLKTQKTPGSYILGDGLVALIQLHGAPLEVDLIIYQASNCKKIAAGQLYPHPF